MSYNVHINVCFACDNNDAVAALAKEHLAKLNLESTYPLDREAETFLVELSARVGPNPGPRGGLSMWGMVGKYTHGDIFVNQLEPFWFDLLSKELPGGPHNFEHVIVFTEEEGTEQAFAYEIKLLTYNIDIVRHKKIVITKHKCPFSWAQF